VLLFQDIAVIPMLAIFPLLAGAAAIASATAHAADATPPRRWSSGLPPWAQTLAVLAAVGAIILGGRYLLAAGVPHVYRETVDTSLRLGADALRLLGFRAYQAQRVAQAF
jgi:Kef-type K+ transport system membrane component KefB